MNEEAWKKIELKFVFGVSGHEWWILSFCTNFHDCSTFNTIQMDGFIITKLKIKYWFTIVHLCKKFQPDGEKNFASYSNFLVYFTTKPNKEKEVKVVKEN